MSTRASVPRLLSTASALAAAITLAASTAVAAVAVSDTIDNAGEQDRLLDGACLCLGLLCCFLLSLP
jgi:formate/nitrite transporter FocA (FNT family)